MATRVPTRKILVTGAQGALGQIVCKRLAQKHRVLAVDHRDAKEEIRHVVPLKLDLRRKSSYSTIKAQHVDAIVHLGVIRNPLKFKEGSHASFHNLETATALLRIAEDPSVRNFIFLSSANLYGPSPITSGFLKEDAPLHGSDRSAELGDLVELDMLMQTFFWKVPDTKTVIFRPAHVIGPTLKNAPTRYFQLKYLPTLMGYDPMLQAIHAEDVAAAIAKSLDHKVGGVFNLSSGTQAPISRIISRMGKLDFPAPEFALRNFLGGLFKLSATHFPAYEIDHLKYACLIDDTRSKEVLGFAPRYTLSAIFDQLSPEPVSSPYRFAPG